MDAPEPESHTDGKLLRPYACTYAPCRKCFSRRSDLVRHVRIHTNERPYKCEFKSCGKCFIQRSALTVHMRTHTGERPHVCEQCGRAFSDSSSLARHRRVHTGKRPYRCPFIGCDKTFCRKTTLMKHHKSHSDDSLSFNSDSGSPKSTSALQSTSTSPSCVTTLSSQCAQPAYVRRLPQNLQSAPASSQTFPHMPPPPSSCPMPPWSSVSANFSLSSSPTPRQNNLTNHPPYPLSLQSHNFLLPVISPQPSPLSCTTFFGRPPPLNPSSSFPQFEQDIFNQAAAAAAYSATPHYGNDPQDFYRQIPKAQDHQAPTSAPLSTVLSQQPFFGSLETNNNQVLGGGPSNSLPTDLFHDSSFPDQLAYVGEPVLGLSLPSNMYSNNRQQPFNPTQPQNSLSHFGFEDPPAVATNPEDLSSCTWQKLNWNRN